MFQNEPQQHSHSIFNMCICSVTVCIFNCLQVSGSIWWLLHWGGGQRMGTAGYDCGLLCGVTWDPQPVSEPQSLHLHNRRVISHTASQRSLRNQQKVRRVGNTSCKPGMRESGGLASGSYLWRRWRRGARPSGRWSPGSRERSRTVPVGRGPSTDHPAAWSTNLQSLTESVSKKKISAENKTKRRRQAWEEMLLPQSVCFSFTNLCDMSHDGLPGAPSSPQVFWRCSSEVWKLHPDLWQLRRTEEPSFFFFFSQRDVYTLPFGRNYVCFLSSCLRVWRTDGKIMLTRARGAFLLVLSQNTFLPHDTMRCSVIIASPNARLYHVLTLARDKKMLWSVQSKIKY